jgi:CAAX prenyl protease-like protein
MNRALLAHVAPMGVFMLLQLVPAWVRVDNDLLPWHQRAPEHWVYPLQVLACAVMLWHWRRLYEFGPWLKLRLSCNLGMLGVVFWVLLGWWLGGERGVGFDPAQVSSEPMGQGVVLVLRALRLVLVVPLVEELFWRGWLLRFVQAGSRWQQQALGRHDWNSFLTLAALLVLAHDWHDAPATLVWASLMQWLWVRTRSLGCCVIMHASGNALLGVWIVQGRHWGWW